MPHQNVENRQFLKIDKVIKCRTTIFAKKIVPAKIKHAFTKELSDSGITFFSKHLLQLSSIVCLDINFKDLPLPDGITEQFLALGDKPVGKVTRIEDAGGGYYNIGVSFFRKSEDLVRYMEYSTISLLIHRLGAYFLKALFILFIIFTTLSVNLIYLEQHEIYHPDKRMYITPREINIPYDEVNFKAEDGQIINGWFIPADKSETVILYCNGRNGNICDQLARIKFFHGMGVNLMMFDYRGYGNNSGKPSEEGFYKDARGAYDYLVSRGGIDKDKIIVFGESLGAAVAAELCLKRKAEALVLESPIVSLAIEKQILYPFLPTEFLLFEKFDTLVKIKNIHIPKLIVHGIDDEMVPFKEALQLYYASPQPRQFLPFNGAHNDDIFKVSDSYKEQLNKFFLDNKIALS